MSSQSLTSVCCTLQIDSDLYIISLYYVCNSLLSAHTYTETYCPCCTDIFAYHLVPSAAHVASQGGSTGPLPTAHPLPNPPYPPFLTPLMWPRPTSETSQLLLSCELSTYKQHHFTTSNAIGSCVLPSTALWRTLLTNVRCYKWT